MTEPMIEKDGLTGDFYVVVNGDRYLLHPLLCAAMDVARNHWDEVLELHYERQDRVKRIGR